MDSCSLYIIESGTVHRLIPDHNISRKMFSLKKGDLLGLHSFLTDEPREESSFCKDYVTVLELKKNDFIEILKNNSTEYVILNSFF